MKLQLKKSHFAITALLLSICAAHAQTAPQANAPAPGVLQAPPDVTTIMSLDAHNVVVIGTRDSQSPSAPLEYSLAVPRHIYSGAIARIFGGTIVPTEALVIPESALRSNFGLQGGVSAFGGNGNMGGGNFGGQNFGGQNQGNGNSNPFSRGFSSYAPRVPIQNLSQFNRVLDIFDRPIQQAQVGVSK